MPPRPSEGNFVLGQIHQGPGVPAGHLRLGLGLGRRRCSSSRLASRGWRRGRGTTTSAEGVQPREGEFHLLLLEAIGTGHGVHAQPALDHQALAHLNPVLQILGQVAEPHHLHLSRGVIGAEPIHPHLHLGDGHLVVLGVADCRSLKHLHLKQAVIHVLCASGATILSHTSRRNQPHD